MISWCKQSYCQPAVMRQCHWKERFPRTPTRWVNKRKTNYRGRITHMPRSTVCVHKCTYFKLRYWSSKAWIRYGSQSQSLTIFLVLFYSHLLDLKRERLKWKKSKIRFACVLWRSSAGMWTRTLNVFIISTRHSSLASYDSIHLTGTVISACELDCTAVHTQVMKGVGDEYILLAAESNRCRIA